MKRGSNNRENEVYTVPPVDPLEGKVDEAALRAFRTALGPAPSGVRTLFDDLLFAPPHIRLLRALNCASRMLLQDGVDAAGVNGLLPVEREALTTLHINGMTVEQLGTAHALLCVPERITFLNQWREEARRVHTQKHSHLTVQPTKED